jgi:hypothetical protein
MLKVLVRPFCADALPAVPPEDADDFMRRGHSKLPFRFLLWERKDFYQRKGTCDVQTIQPVGCIVKAVEPELLALVTRLAASSVPAPS